MLHRTLRLTPFAFVSSVALFALGCSDSGAGIRPEDASTADRPRDARADVPTDRPALPTLVGVVPDHGSFLGGTEVTLRGSNFTEDAVVFFGESMVQPRFTTFVDRGRITVLTPAGRPGDVDVRIVTGDRSSTLPHGYHYDSFYVDPVLGPITGNARVSIHGSGTHFADGMTITFDGMPCTMVRVTGPELVSCLTPAHPEGRVSVTTTAGTETLTVPDAYQYANSADQVGGGLSGGTLQGSLTVTVLNAMTGAPVPQAFVFLENDPRAVPPRAGQTDERGQATLSPPEFRPPVTVTASKNCFTNTTIQAFDARAATIYLTPLMLPECGMGMGEGMAQRPVYPATITGELVWAGPNEFAPNPWDNIPEPRGMNERRVAYVTTSRPDIFTQDPPPAMPPAYGQVATLLEVIPMNYGGRGYPFRIIARPASVAVYAIAGIEVNYTNATTRRFIPYMMGVARAVLGSPNATVSNVIVPMEIPLDHETQLDVQAYPLTGTETTPNIFQANAFIDLGGEGVMPMAHAVATGRASGTYTLSGLPALSGSIADGRLTVHARYASGTITGPRAFQDTPAPCTGLIIQGVTTPDETIRVRDWLGVPNMTAPQQLGRLPADRTVRFGFNTGTTSPDLLILNMQWATGAWQHLAPGAERAIQYPDLSALMGLQDLPAGSLLQLSLVGVRIPNFNFNQFTYTTIGQGYWTAYAGRGTLVQR